MQNSIRYLDFRFQWPLSSDRKTRSNVMEAPDIFEFRTTWNNEFFSKTRSTRSAAKRLVRKSVAIGNEIRTNKRSCRHVFSFVEKARRSRRQKLIDEDLVLRLETTEKDRQVLTEYCRSSSFAEHLQRVRKKRGESNR